MATKGNPNQMLLRLCLYWGLLIFVAAFKVRRFLQLHSDIVVSSPSSSGRLNSVFCRKAVEFSNKAELYVSSLFPRNGAVPNSAANAFQRLWGFVGSFLK